MTIKELRIKRRGRIRRELSRQQSLERYRRIAEVRARKQAGK